MAPEPTLERPRAHLGLKVPVRRPDIYAHNPFAPLYDLEAARDELGYEAQFDLRALLYPAEAAGAW